MHSVASHAGHEPTHSHPGHAGSGHPVIECAISLGKPLSRDLVDKVTAVCDEGEDAGANALVCIHLDGSGTAEANRDGAHPAIDVGLVNHWERALRRLERLPVVTVAVATGEIGGLGLALLLCTDYRLVDEASHLRLAQPGQPPLPGMLLHRLSNQLGVTLTRRMALLERRLDSHEALRHGLIDEVCANVGAAARAVLQDLRQRDLAHASMQRRLILEASSVSYEDALGSHLAACDRVLRHATQTP